MDQMKAYAELAAELNHYRQLPYEELALRVGGPIIERSVDSLDGPLTIEVCIRWWGSLPRSTITLQLDPECWVDGSSMGFGGQTSRPLLKRKR